MIGQSISTDVGGAVIVMEPSSVSPCHHDELIPLNRNYVPNKTSVSEMDDLIPFHRRRATPTPAGNVHHHYTDTGRGKISILMGALKIVKVYTATTKSTATPSNAETVLKKIYDVML